MDSWERFKEESLPDKEYFYSKLNIEHITDEDYAHTQKVFFVFCFCFFFSIWVFFYEHSQITGLQRKGEHISLTPHYHFHQLHRHLDISRAITAES